MSELAIESVWQAYSQSLERLLRAKVANSADVDDLLQEVLIKTHQQIGTLRSSDKLKPWLYRLAHNAVIDHYRRQGRRQLADGERLWFDDDGVDAEQQLGDCVLPFIHSLPSQAAALLQAVDIEGRSQRELAAELGIGYSALKSRVQRAREQLRRQFERCCELELDRQGRIVDYQQRRRSCCD